MKVNMYSIYDEAATAYISPFSMHNDGLAIRAFQDNVNAKDENNISKHPQHFSLFKLAEYDDATGVIEPITPPKFLVGGVEMKNPTEESNIIAEIKTLKAYMTSMQTLKEIK